MHIEIIKPGQKKQYSLITSIILLILGIVLVTNSNQFITIIFEIMGAFLILFGIFRFLAYFKLRKQFKTEDSDALINGIICITVGLLIILLAGVLEVGLRFIIGFCLLFSGINKINFGLRLKETKKIFSTTIVIEGILLTLIGLYSIFFANVALVIVGIILIISSIIDIINNLKY